MDERVVKQPCRIATDHSRTGPQSARTSGRSIRDRPSGAGRGAGRRAGARAAARAVCGRAGGRGGHGHGAAAGATSGGRRLRGKRGQAATLAAWRGIGADGRRALWSRPRGDRHCPRAAVTGCPDRHGLVASGRARRPALSGAGSGDSGSARSPAAHRPDRHATTGAGGGGIGRHRPDGADRRRSGPQCGGNPLAGGRCPLRAAARRRPGAQRLRPYFITTAGGTGRPALARGMAGPARQFWRL